MKIKIKRKKDKKNKYKKIKKLSKNVSKKLSNYAKGHSHIWENSMRMNDKIMGR